jgi:hypothetical protein
MNLNRHPETDKIARALEESLSSYPERYGYLLAVVDIMCRESPAARRMVKDATARIRAQTKQDARITSDCPTRC